MEWLTIGISLIALVVAVIQTFISKQQLKEAQETKSDTEELLDEIKEKVVKIEGISDDTKRTVSEQMAKLIDKQDENIKTLLNSPHKSEQNQMMNNLFSSIFSSPENLKTIMELSKENKKEK
jgi:heme exporter protein D